MPDPTTPDTPVPGRDVATDLVYRTLVATSYEAWGDIPPDAYDRENCVLRAYTTALMTALTAAGLLVDAVQPAILFDRWRAVLPGLGTVKGLIKADARMLAGDHDGTVEHSTGLLYRDGTEVLGPWRRVEPEDLGDVDDTVAPPPDRR